MIASLRLAISFWYLANGNAGARLCAFEKQQTYLQCSHTGRLRYCIYSVETFRSSHYAIAN